MFYYKENGVIIAKSETQIKVKKGIEEIELKENFENPVIENGNIINLIDSYKYKAEQNEKFLLENKEEIDNLKKLGYKVEIKGLKIIKTETNESLKIKKEMEILLKKQKIEQEFQNTIQQITAGYTQAEIDTWTTKVAEAKKVIAGGTSDLLSSLLIKGENVLDFSKNILKKAKEYSEIYYSAEKTKREKLKNLK